jgi:tetratricopeptide (TPR) repeat protein
MELGWAALYQGQLEKGERLVREGMAICQEIGDRASIATGLSSLGSIFILLGKYSEARSLKEESLAICDDLGLRAEIAFSNTSLCHAQMHLGHYGPARTHGQRGLGFFREIGSQWGIGLSLCYLGWVALAEEEYAEAQELLEESAAADEKIGQRDHLGGALAALGYATRGLEQPSQAQEYLSRALRMASETENFMAVVHALSGIALLLADRGEVERAIEIYALASRHPFVANSRWFEDVVGKQIAAGSTSVSPEVVAAAQERGRGKDLDVTVKGLLAELEGRQMPDAP